MSQLELARNVGKSSAAYIAYIEWADETSQATDLTRIATHLKVRLSYFYP